MSKTDKRECILEAAFHLFLTKGLSDTKMIEIANLAGVGKGTIYEYFSSKDELFEILFERKVFSFYRGLDHVLEKQTSAKSKIKAYLSFDAGLTEELDISREVVYNLLLESGPGQRCTTPAKKCIKELMRYRFSVLHSIIAEGVENGEFASMDPLMATTAVMGAMAFYLSFNLDLFDDHDLEEFKKDGPWENKDFLRLILSGLCRENSCA